MPPVPAGRLGAAYACANMSQGRLASEVITHSFTQAAPTSTLPPVLLVRVKVLPPT